MKRSTERILTTHTGSLPRPDDLTNMILEHEGGGEIDTASFETRVKSATAEIVERQVKAGVDIVNDGEMGKPGYANYVKDRLEGFGGEGRGVRRQAEADEFPEHYERMNDDPTRRNRHIPACVGPVKPGHPEAVAQDIANLRAAVQAMGADGPTDVFMTAASPGVIAHFLENQYYKSHEEYLSALAEAMRPEYEAIAAAGFVLQLDCPDLAMSRASAALSSLSTEQFRDRINLQIEALNQAIANIPPDQMRLHLCWGNYEAPHMHDIPFADIVDLVFKARPSAISFEAANPRHAHEWTLFESVDLPDDKLLIPGVLDSSTNYVEHPELIAQRIERYARLVGRENVMAGSDCGFGTFVGRWKVDPKVTFAKLQAMSEGARIASERLW